MVMRGRGKTDIGKQREQNEDSFFADDDLGLFVVADGMGGHAGGEIAATISIETVVEHVRQERATLAAARAAPLEVAPLRWLAEDAVQAASHAVFERAARSRPLHGMGCTLTVLLAAGDKAVMAHVGDSRLYLARAQRAVQLTADHTFAQDLASSGLIPQAEVKGHQFEHVLTRAVGIKAEVHVDTKVLDLLPGDLFLLCSDGLSEYVTDPDWLAEQLDASDFDSLPEALIRFANESGGKDNITVVVARVDEDGMVEPTPGSAAGIVAEVVPLWAAS